MDFKSALLRGLDHRKYRKSIIMRNKDLFNYIRTYLTPFKFFSHRFTDDMEL